MINIGDKVNVAGLEGTVVHIETRWDGSLLIRAQDSRARTFTVIESKNEITVNWEEW